MSKIKDLPEGLQPFAFHKMDYQLSGKEATADCPFCGREAKFSINTDTSQWRCLVCDESGNAQTFLKRLWEESKAATTDYKELSNDRNVKEKTLEQWGFAQSLLTEEWIVPGFSAAGAVSQLYRWVTVMSKGKRKKRLLATPPAKLISQGMFGANQIRKKKSVIMVTEGVWDGMALWEELGGWGTDGKDIIPCSDIKDSLQQETNVVSIPGCSTFRETWLPAFKKKSVSLLFDNDYPREHNNRKIDPAAWTGLQKVSSKIGQTAKIIEYLAWDPTGMDHSTDYPKGMDVTDFLDAGNQLPDLLSKFMHVPEEWKKEQTGGERIYPRKCDSWKVLTKQWRLALQWSQGLDVALSVMLASSLSTEAAGEQLWIKVVGPASCLDEDQVVYDPIDKSRKTVKERCELGDKFFVYSMKESGDVGVCQALPPEKLATTSMYELEFSSGSVLRVTGGHQLWNGSSYVVVDTISRELSLSSSYPLLTILESDLLAQTQDVPRWRQTAEDYQDCYSSCLCLYGGQLLEGLDTDQDVLPSQDDALTYTLESSYWDGYDTEDTHSLLENSTFHLSSCNAESFFWSLQNAYVYEHHVVATHVSQFPYENPLLSQLQTGWFQEDHTIQQLCLYDSHSKQTDIQHSLETGSDQYDSDQSLVSWQSQFETYQIHIDPHTVESFQETSLSSPLDEIQYQVLSSVSSIQSTHTLGSYNTQPSYGLCTTLQEASVSSYSKPISSQYLSITKVHNTLDRTILSRADNVVKVRYIGEKECYDFSVPETKNYWAGGYIHHNCGKSTLSEALNVANNYIISKDTFTGLTSGYMTGDGETNSFVAQLHGKTLIINDGDTLLQMPNLNEILSQLRAFYGRNIRVQYKNAASADFENINATIIICGTGSLRALDTSELGERFLDCVIMEDIDEDYEDMILKRIVEREDKNVSSDSKKSSKEPHMKAAMELTGGYVEYLRQNHTDILEAVTISKEHKMTIAFMAKFVAIMRARPSTMQTEKAEREVAGRLASQLTRLAKCLAGVLNKTKVDNAVMRRCAKVMGDTARGITLELCETLYDNPRGVDTKYLAAVTNRGEAEVRKLMRFLVDIKAVKQTNSKMKVGGIRKKRVWTLSKSTMSLIKRVEHLF